MLRCALLCCAAGAVVGAIPPLMGWAAAAGELDVGAAILAVRLSARSFPSALPPLFPCTLLSASQTRSGLVANGSLKPPCFLAPPASCAVHASAYGVHPWRENCLGPCSSQPRRWPTLCPAPCAAGYRLHSSFPCMHACTPGTRLPPLLARHASSLPPSLSPPAGGALLLADASLHGAGMDVQVSADAPPCPTTSHFPSAGSISVCLCSAAHAHAQWAKASAEL